MGLSNTVNSVTYQGDGVTSVFAYAFNMPASADAEVVIYNSATGLFTTLVLTTDFSVSGIGLDTGGNVTLVAGALAATKTVTISRIMPLTQDLTLTNESGFLPTALTTQLNKIVMMVQQVNRLIRRVLGYRGSWLTATAYAVNDTVRSTPAGTYVCAIAHTSGTFATDLAAGKWVPLALDGATGATGATGAAGTNGTNGTNGINGTGTGDVVGPAGVTDSNPAVFDTTTGKLLKQSSYTTFWLNLYTALSGKATPINADGLVTFDSTAAGAAKITTYLQAWTNFFKGKADLLYPSVAVGMINGTIVSSRAASAETYSIKTLAGTDASATDPVTFLFPNTTGGYTSRQITAALSITIPSTKHTGAGNGVPFRNWISAMDNGGTVELAIRNCTDLNGISGVNPNGLMTTSAIAGANANKTNWSTTARAALSSIIIGWAEYPTGQAAQGTWASVDVITHVQQRGDPIPGSILQNPRTSVTGVVTGATTIPNDDTIPQSGEGVLIASQAITPNSQVNLLDIDFSGPGTSSGSADDVSTSLIQDSTANALAARLLTTANLSYGTPFGVSYRMIAGTLVSTTFKIRVGCNTFSITINGKAGARTMGGVSATILDVKEYMA